MVFFPQCDFIKYIENTLIEKGNEEVRFTKYIPQSFMMSFNRHKMTLIALKVSQFPYQGQTSSRRLGVVHASARPTPLRGPGLGCVLTWPPHPSACWSLSTYAFSFQCFCPYFPLLSYILCLQTCKNVIFWMKLSDSIWMIEIISSFDNYVCVFIFLFIFIFVYFSYCPLPLLGQTT